MTNKRYKEITNEGLTRLILWLQNSNFDEMTKNGSKIQFDMSLGLVYGYPFEKKDWMNENDFKPFVSETEFNSYLYNEIINNLYMIGYKWYRIKKNEY